MIREINYCVDGDAYSFTEDGIEIFKVNKEKLEFNVKDFYNAFFSNGKDYTEIHFKSTEFEDKTAKHVYEVTQNMITEVVKNLKEEKEQ